jgi:hypothetical protein
MSQHFDFTKFVPGFDFLKSLTPAAGASSTATQWVAPTLNPEEIDKRISELKTVHFWLDQNTKAVAATIQALEVQRMTLSALKDMNVSFTEMAQSLKIKPLEPAKPEATEAHSDSSQATSDASSSASETQAQGVQAAQWWGAVTQQFQQIASKTMSDLAKNAAVHEQLMAKQAAAKTAAAKTPSATPQRKTTTSTARTTSARKTSASGKASVARKKIKL